MESIAIRSQGVGKWFGQGDAKTHAVRDVSFEAHFREMLYIVGPSGSGKTTLLSMISGILRPDEGRVEVEGRDVWALRENARAEFRLRKIGFVFQDFHLFPNLTAAENVAIPLVLQRYDWAEALRKATKYLDIVGLASRTHLNPTRLSGGEQQRVAIARALASGPDSDDFGRTHGVARRRHRKEARRVCEARSAQRQAQHRRRDPRRPYLRICRPHSAHGRWAAAGRDGEGRCVTK